MRFFATVPVGLEFVALDELRELQPSCSVPHEAELRAPWPCNWRVTKDDKKLLRRIQRGLEPETTPVERPVDEEEITSRTKPSVMPGILSFDCQLPEADCLRQSMRSAKAIFVQLADMELPEDREAAHYLMNHTLLSATDEEWGAAVSAWRSWTEASEETHSLSWRPSFRATVHKQKDYGNFDRKWAFTSVESGGWLGWGVEQRLGWKVDLKHFDINVVCFVYRRRALLGLALSDINKTNTRNRIVFGKTSLQVQEAFCMAKLAAPRPGDVLLDVFCGTGIIPIEAQQRYPQAVCLCSDAEAEETEMSRANSLYSGCPGVGVLLADASCLPFRDGCVSRIVSDMPWGRRSGGHKDNQQMYPLFLKEARRVLRDDGEMWLLTLEKSLMRQGLFQAEAGKGWEIVRVYHVNNGYDVALFHLRPV